MKRKLKFFARALPQLHLEKNSRAASRYATLLVVALLTVVKANAARVGVPAGGTTLTQGSTVTISSSTSFPLKIMADGIYTVEGSYGGDYGPPCGYSGSALSSAQVTERKTPAIGSGNMIDVGASNHGIYVASGLKNVTVILKNVGLQTTGAFNAAFVIDGVDADKNTTAASYQNNSNGSSVIIRLPAGTKSFLYSCRGQNDGKRAAVEVWKGSTVYIEGEGSLLAKTAVSRCYQNISPPRRPDASKPQGSPYWDGTDASLSEQAQNGGAAGIGAGDIGGSGGNVVIRGNPKVIAIAGAHGAGIGGGWGVAGSYHSDVLIYGGTVESWGGAHGAGIGGGCAGGDGSIVVLPTANVYSASYDPDRAMLGQMNNVIYFGNPDDSRLALYTEDYREVDMFLDMSKNVAVRDVIERLGGGMNPSYLPLGKTRDNWPANDNNQHRPNYTDWAATTSPAVEQGSGKYVLLLNGGFIPSGIKVAFLTAAKTEKNHSYTPVVTTSNTTTYLNYLTTTGGLSTYGLDYPSLTDGYNNNSPSATHYAYTSPASRPVPRFVMIAPTYLPSVSLTPLTAPNLHVGYPVTHPSNKITLKIGNSGNQKLYNPHITITGDDYELISSPGTPLQTAVNTALSGLLASDAGGQYIPVGASFTLELRLKAGKNPGSSYDGWILFSADNLQDFPVPKQFNINVLDKFMLPPDLEMEMPTDTVVNGPFKIRAKFKSQTGVYPHPVTDLQIGNIFVDYGTVTAVTGDPAKEGPSGFFSDWIIDITPKAGLPNETAISVVVKQNSAKDSIGANTRTVSQPKRVTFSSRGPYISFSVAEGSVLPSLDTILIYVDGNGITPNKQDSVYIAGHQFTETGCVDSLRNHFTLKRLPSTTLDIATAGQYVLSVVNNNYLKIGSPVPVGFMNGNYELDIPGNYIHNYDGNYLPNTTLHFSIQMPEIPDGAGLGGAIIPSTLNAAGGPVRIWIYGKHLLAAKGRLAVVLRNAIPGYTANHEMYVPSADFTDTTAYVDVVLPPNLSTSPQTYDFTIRLYGRLPLTDINPDLRATVNPTTAIIDTTQTVQGHKAGLRIWPHTQSFEGGAIDFRLVGENLFHLNLAPNSNLRIRVKKNGMYTSAVIPVSVPATLGGIVIPMNRAFTTEKNLSPGNHVYVFELWHDVGGTPTPVPESGSGLPYIADSVTVKSGLNDLTQTLRSTHHVVSQRVANTPPSVRAWLVPKLNAIEVLRNFGLTVSENDIIFTSFDSAVEGTAAVPKGWNGHFTFTLKLHTVPAIEITLNTGEIEALHTPPVSIMRQVFLPEAKGYLTDPPTGKHHIESGRDFTFYLVPVSDETRMIVPKVTTDRLIGSDAEGVVIERKEDGAHYLVTIREIRESITIYINKESPEANEDIASGNVWGEKGKLCIRTSERGEALVYNALGSLFTTVPLEAGETTAVSLPAGIYIVSFRGVTCKAIVR
ncbi:MAG: hypothetical protein LBP64_04190 [Tannerella sp.]|nr:hypothetical protein [Tannerella sp.]